MSDVETFISALAICLEKKMRRVLNFAFSTVLLLSMAAPGLAQVEEPEPEPKSYVMSYFIVGAGIGLGLVAVCRASSRRKEVRKPEEKSE